MKKIFLTSGIILCMACPAFAETGFSTTDIENGTEVANGIEIAGACVEPKLGVYSGSVTLRAKWQGVYKTITLNSNVDTSAGGVVANPSTLYITDGDNNQKLLYTSLTNGTLGDQVNINQTPFAADTPLGNSVTYTINLNDSSEGNGSTTASLNGATVNPAHRELLGFYYDADPEDETAPVQMIDANGILTADGLAVAGNQEWTANWGTGTPTISGTPTRDGYQFARWDLNTDDVVEAPGAVSSDTNVYAIWNANTFNITYSCDDGEGGQGTPSTQSDTFTFDTQDAWAGNLDANNCGRAGYHFTGWDCTSGNTSILSNGGATQVLDQNDNPVSGSYTGNSVSISGSPWASLANGATVACTAHYEKNTIGLTFNIDGTTSGGQCTYSEGIVLPESPTKPGFVFDGWEIVPTSLDPDENLYNPANP
ncbi:MAG: InlB B-repeat-containing protein [Alphaproteobacteria bacterium]|nr:InlB B-repeat-containing protein [Alphaproteobacteria bacterium]